MGLSLRDKEATQLRTLLSVHKLSNLRAEIDRSIFLDVFRHPPHLPIHHQTFLPWSPSMMDGLLNYEKGREVFISLFWPRPQPPDGVGGSFLAEKSIKSSKEPFFWPQQPLLAPFPLRGHWAPSVCPGGGGSRGGERAMEGRANLHRLDALFLLPPGGSPFLPWLAC